MRAITHARKRYGEPVQTKGGPQNVQSPSRFCRIWHFHAPERTRQVLADGARSADYVALDRIPKRNDCAIAERCQSLEHSARWG
jgi:hypothetical protein